MKKGLTYNPAYMNPDDLAEIGVDDGRHDRDRPPTGRPILGVVEATRRRPEWRHLDVTLLGRYAGERPARAHDRQSRRTGW